MDIIDTSNFKQTRAIYRPVTIRKENVPPQVMFISQMLWFGMAQWYRYNAINFLPDPRPTPHSSPVRTRHGVFCEYQLWFILGIIFCIDVLLYWTTLKRHRTVLSLTCESLMDLTRAQMSFPTLCFHVLSGLNPIGELVCGRCPHSSEMCHLVVVDVRGPFY